MDWRTIDTSTLEGKRQLDAQIAQRLGWELKREPWMDETMVKIYDPDGVLMYHESNTWTSLFGVNEIQKIIPRYSSDLNAAFKLIKDEPLFEIAFNNPQMGSVHCSCWIEPHGYKYAEAADGNLALAICRWFLTADEARTGAMKSE